MTEISAFKSCLLDEIDGAVYFRSTKAEEYPNDERNARAVECLTLLRENLETLPETNTSLRKCFYLYREKHRAAGNLDFAWLEGGLWHPGFGQVHEGPIDPASTPGLFARYGFDEEQGGDAVAFLASLHSNIADWEPSDLRLGA